MKRRFLIPEVIQTSATDCGPAALKALFAGFGQYLSYGRLREVCQTDVDGTSIDVLEGVAQHLGMDAAQRMMPPDLLLRRASGCLPSLVVTRLPDGATHFVVLWRSYGSRVQLMDPADGRLWVNARDFLKSLHLHEQIVARADWEEWAQSPEFSASLLQRLHESKIATDLWADRAHLDATLRLIGTLRTAGALQDSDEVQELFALCKQNPGQIPPFYWFASAVEGEPDQIRLRGAVLLTASGLQAARPRPESLPESLSAVLTEPPPRPWTEALAALRSHGNVVPGVLATALAFAAAGTMLEAVLFLGLLESTRHLELAGQRIGAVAWVIVLFVGLLAVEWSASQGLMALGRQLEMRFRSRLLTKIPALGDSYFRSRLISDMAFRAHSLHLLRELPELAGRLLHGVLTLVFTATAIAWFYPGAALSAGLAVLGAVAMPFIFQGAMVERDLRVRENAGALSRFYLDALLGSRAIQAHGAERVLRAAHLPRLKEWAHASLRQQTLLVTAEVVQLAIMLLPLVLFVHEQNPVTLGSPAMLLLVYWVLSIPGAGQELASTVWSLPRLRNTLVRYLEPLDAPEQQMGGAPLIASTCQGAEVNLAEVSVNAGGHVILDDVSLQIAAGEHVAIVGSSGAGKSALVGLLLGWHFPASGRVSVDGVPLDSASIAGLRVQTAWIDPQVHVFAATLLDNLVYGRGSPLEAGQVESLLQDADLFAILKKLPGGMLTEVGEGGPPLSGGEAQRVRIGRSLAKPGVRLAILDEPTRGLERSLRSRMQAILRERFATATLLCVSHDVSDTLAFDRVVVMDAGRIVEAGPPRELHARSSSRYRKLFEQDLEAARAWSSTRWQRMRMSRGALDAIRKQAE